MPIARSGFGSVVVDDRIYAFGGEGSATGTGVFANNQEYDPSTDTWREVAPMVTPRHGTDGALVGRTVYAPAGGTADGVHDAVSNETFAIDLDGSWTTLPSLPAGEQRREGGVVVLDDQLYVIGGNKGSNDRTATVLRYDITAATWASTAAVAPIPGPGLDHIGAVVLNGSIYMMGGWEENPVPDVATLLRYDPASNAWTQLADMPDSQGASGATVIDGKIYVVGGKQQGSRVGDLYVYDPATDQWEIEAPMPTERDHVQAATLGGKLYAFGGFIGSYPSGVTDVVEVYDPATGDWSTASPMPTGRGDLGISVVNGRALLFGGVNGAGITGVTEEYDPSTDTWRTVTTMGIPRRATGGAAANGVVYAPGGSASEVDPSVASFESFVLPLRTAVGGCNRTHSHRQHSNRRRHRHHHRHHHHRHVL